MAPIDVALRNVLFTLGVLCLAGSVSSDLTAHTFPSTCTLCLGLPYLLYLAWFACFSLQVPAWAGFCPHCHHHALALYFVEKDLRANAIYEAEIDGRLLLSTRQGFEVRGGRELYFTTRGVIPSYRFRQQRHGLKERQGLQSSPHNFCYYGCAHCDRRYRRLLSVADMDLLGQNWHDASGAEYAWAYAHGRWQAQLEFYNTRLTPIKLGDLKLLRQRQLRDVEFYYEHLLADPQWLRLKHLFKTPDELWEYQQVIFEPQGVAGLSGDVYGYCGLADVYGYCGLALVRGDEVLLKVEQGYFRFPTRAW